MSSQTAGGRNVWIYSKQSNCYQFYPGNQTCSFNHVRWRSRVAEMGCVCVCVCSAVPLCTVRCWKRLIPHIRILTKFPHFFLFSSLFVELTCVSSGVEPLYFNYDASRLPLRLIKVQLISNILLFWCTLFAANVLRCWIYKRSVFICISCKIIYRLL
jgi:hypothetical protein